MVSTPQSYLASPSDNSLPGR